jgi:hypothetical protein
MKRNQFLSLISASVAMIFASCNSSSSGTDDTGEEYLYDIVTYTACSDNGSSYSVQKDDNSTPAILTATQRIDTTYVKVGQRVLIAYTLPSGTPAYTSSSITLKGYQSIINGAIESTTSAPTNESQNVVSAWITGKYLNIYSQCDVRSAPKTYSLLLDKSTADKEYPTVYLVFISDNTFSSSQKNIYASFDISELKNNSAYSGFTLTWNPYYGNGTGTQVFRFTNGAEVIKPLE